MNNNKLDKRKIRRLKRRTALRERRVPVDYVEMDNNDAQIILDAVFSYINDHRNEPRMELCTVSRDQGKTWIEELVNVAITDPNLSTLKVGDLVRETRDGTICVIVANEGENQIFGAFQDDPDSPLFVPEGHLYWDALPYN